MASNLEIEKKYIIEYPDEEFLLSVPKCECTEIEQIYLVSDSCVSERIRKRGAYGKYKYYHTVKRRINVYIREEDEKEITEAEYNMLKRRANPSLNVIRKKRYVIPYKGYMLEIDVFPFWDKQAYLEIELETVQDCPPVPEYIKCMCDVTNNEEYTNRALAAKIPEQIL